MTARQERPTGRLGLGLRRRKRSDPPIRSLYAFAVQAREWHPPLNVQNVGDVNVEIDIWPSEGV
jgi:hypothetical protein